MLTNPIGLQNNTQLTGTFLIMYANFCFLACFTKRALIEGDFPPITCSAISGPSPPAKSTGHITG